MLINEKIKEIESNDFYEIFEETMDDYEISAEEEAFMRCFAQETE